MKEPILAERQYKAAVAIREHAKSQHPKPNHPRLGLGGLAKSIATRSHSVSAIFRVFLPTRRSHGSRRAVIIGFVGGLKLSR